MCSGPAARPCVWWGRKVRTTCCPACWPTQQPQTLASAWTMAPACRRGWTSQFTGTVVFSSTASTRALTLTTSAQPGSTEWRRRPRPFPSTSFRVRNDHPQLSTVIWIYMFIKFDLWFPFSSRASLPSIRLLGDRWICAHCWRGAQDSLHHAQPQLQLQRHLEIHHQVGQCEALWEFCLIAVAIIIWTQFSSLLLVFREW